MARVIGLHLRFPTATSPDPFVDALRSLFNHYGSGIAFEVRSSQSEDQRLESIDVGACVNGPSPHADAAFRALVGGPLPDDEIAVLLARSLQGAPRWGCAHCPPGWRGVILSCDAPVVALPHEIAHLILGPGHDPDPANLMFADSAAITANPPLLQPSQITTLQAAVWAMPAVVAPAFALQSKAVGRAPVIRERPPAVPGPRRQQPKKKAAKKRPAARKRAATKRRKPQRRKKTASKRKNSRRRRQGVRGRR